MPFPLFSLNLKKNADGEDFNQFLIDIILMYNLSVQLNQIILTAKKNIGGSRQRLWPLIPYLYYPWHSRTSVKWKSLPFFSQKQFVSAFENLKLCCDWVKNKQKVKISVILSYDGATEREQMSLALVFTCKRIFTPSFLFF